MTDTTPQDVQSTGDAPFYRVVVFAIPEDPHDLRDVLVSQLGLNAIDAQMQVHALPGVLGARLDRKRAEALVAAIEPLKVATLILPEAELPDLSHPHLVHHLRCLDEGLELVGLTGEREILIPWEHVDMVSVGSVPLEPHVAIDASSVATITTGRKHFTEPLTRSVTPQGLEAWLVTSDPDRVLKIQHQRMNYEYLGRRMEESAFNNFRLLVQDLINRAYRTSLTPATRHYFEHGLQKDIEFRSSHELEAATLLHLLLSRQLQNRSMNDPGTPPA